jgi:hypothetical protein
VAAESAALRPGQIWECSHTGGHRFAPTGVLLPYGQTFGRLSGSSAVAALDAGMHAEIADQLLGARYDRGRSHLIAAGQVAESQVREHLREHRLLALSTTVTPRSNVENCSPQNSGAQNSGAQNSGEENSEEDNTWSCRVSHTDGRHWDVLVVRRPSGAPLPESCGKEPVPMWQWSVLDDAGRPILEA